MPTNRRTWFKKISLLAAGLYISRIEAIASPVASHISDHPNDSSPGTPIRLSSNENPYGPSPLTRKAMEESILRSNRYPWTMIGTFIEALAEKNEVHPEQVIIGAGSTQIIDLVVQYAALQKGTFVVADPTFSRWKDAAAQSGLQKIAVPLTATKQHNLKAMLQAIKADTRLVYICNPNNPTGTICPYDELLSFVAAASRKTLVLVDEAYLDYTRERSLSSLVKNNKNLIIVKTFSKIYGLAGARVGYALAHETTAEQLSGLQSGTNMSISAASLAAALASLKDDDFIRKSYALNEEARAFTIAQLESLHIPCIPSGSNFIYFSLAHYQRDFFALLKAHDIQGTEIFEEAGKWSRITVGTMQEMQQFIRAIT